MKKNQIISAPSILGLKPNGVQELAASLLSSGLARHLGVTEPLMEIETLNTLYNNQREPGTKCLNSQAIKDFSLALSHAISDSINKNQFAFVLGGDCSILLGIMPALKKIGNYGIVFIDAHADFYEPEKSTTGEVADMDLAIITGRGPEVLTNIGKLRPYVMDENVIHIGQRDWEETKKYGSQDIRETAVKCISLEDIEKKGIDYAVLQALNYIDQSDTDGFWIHFDTDVLSDEFNPAVDYHLPGGLDFGQTERLIRNLLMTGRMMGISVTIFNPRFDSDGQISKNITESLGRAFDFSFTRKSDER